MTSTLSGLTSKTEKPKGKFQSLDINKIYKSSRGESSEKQQQKSAVTYKHGMQSLGKVPSTRRAPANLPSLKSEHSGTDAAVPLVPTGGPGWGKQESGPAEAPPAAPPAPPVTIQSSHQQAIALPVTTTIPYPQKPPTTDKSWSTVMTSGDNLSHPPPFQGPQFNHEFPSLNSADQQTAARPEPGQYPSPGLSLRPQTEGSWISGGSMGPDSVKQGPALGAPPQLRPQTVPQQQPFPPQYRGVMPNFMFKNSSPANGLSAPSGPAAPQNPLHERNVRTESKTHAKSAYSELALPSIIKEEELNRMDQIEKDMNWAYQSDIDYNQKLAFSDDEVDAKHSKKEEKQSLEKSKKKTHNVDADSRPAPSTRESSSEDDDSKIRRNQLKEIELAVERAKQRKQEEEKRFSETTKQGAHKKLKELEERISRRERGDSDEGNRTINPMTVPTKIITPPVEIPLPDFQKEKEKEERPQQPSFPVEMEPPRNDFKHLTQIESKNNAINTNRKPVPKNEPTVAPNFSKHFQSNLPPRFKKQQHHMQNMQPPPMVHYGVEQFVSLPTPSYPKEVPKKSRSESPDLKENTNNRINEMQHQQHYDIYTDFNGKSCEIKDVPKQDEIEKIEKNKGYEKAPQRIDPPKKETAKSPKGHREFDYCTTWGDSKFEIAFEEKRTFREDRRVVPGPITKDRIEADDLRNEKRHLTQLKKGQMPDKKITDGKLKEDVKKETSENNYADQKFTKLKTDTKPNAELKKRDTKLDDDKQRNNQRGGNKTYNNQKPWNDYHSRPANNWPKRPYVKPKSVGTDSEGSAEEPNADKNRIKPPRDEKKERRNNEQKNYVPRGEPSRHGRGGGNVRGRMGLSKRIDGYGPPPSKSPFSHNEEHEKINDKENKITDDVKSEEKSVNRKNQTSSGRSNDNKKYSTNKTDFGKQGSFSNEKKDAEPRAPIESKSKDNATPDDDESSAYEESDGFQEVRGKNKSKPKVEEKPVLKREPIKERALKPPKPSPSQQLTQQQIQNIPPLMATLISPPQMLRQASRQNKIPPRFAKQREIHRLQRMQQQHHQQQDVDMGKQGRSGPPSFGPKVAPIANAWDKPLATTQIRNVEENILGGVVNVDACKPLEQNGGIVAPTDQNDKLIVKSPVISDKGVLDGSTPPVNTIIFENTNFKTAPNNRKPTSDKIRKSADDAMENSALSNFGNKSVGDILSKDKSDPIQLQLPFKEDSSDMKLDFLDSELTHLTDEKSSKNLCMPTRTMHDISASPGNTNNISTAETLNFKIQSVKKVWETPSDHTGAQEDQNNSFSSSFVSDQNSLDPSSFVKANDGDDGNEHAYSPTANQATTNNTTNICKVKPTQQISGASNQVVSSSNAHQPHSGMLGPGLMGNPLSPPPITPVLGAGVGMGQPPQQYPTNQHISYQGLGSSSQYGVPTIPSPPSVLPYTQPTLQAPTASLYGAFQIDQTGVLSSQGRSQYSQYPNHYGLGQAGSSPYSAQSMFLQTAQGHPTPSAPPPEMYQNMNNYRLSTAAQFGQNQQLNNPSTVLISSTSNSLMSASVKPSSQQISAIGTKAGGVGQAYQQQSQQGQQMYMATFDPSLQANYLQGAGVLQRPGGPVQNNVVPTIPPSSSFYSGSTGNAKPFNCTWRF